MLKKIAVGLLIALVLIQFFHPAKNDSNDDSKHISTIYPYPDHINKIMQRACNDCHSNNTQYPWYAKVQPGAWYLNGHVKGGKKHLNFSTFANLPIAVQYHKLEETIELVDEKKMPISSYTYFGLHKDAKLSDAQRKEIITWAKEIRTQMKKSYPADSLVRKQKKRG